MVMDVKSMKNCFTQDVLANYLTVLTVGEEIWAQQVIIAAIARILR